jgi:hypothetical protein
MLHWTLPGIGNIMQFQYSKQTRIWALKIRITSSIKYAMTTTVWSVLGTITKAYTINLLPINDAYREQYTLYVQLEYSQKKIQDKIT